MSAESVPETVLQDPPGLHLANLEKAFADLPGFDPSRPLSPRLLAGGRSNVTYLLSQGEHSWVLRRPPLGHVMPSAHDMAREYRVLEGLTRAGFPVPRPLLLNQDKAVIGADFMVMEYVTGRVIADAADSATLEAPDASGVSAALVSSLAQLHEVDAEACGLGAFGRPQGYLQRQTRRWADQWQHTKTRELESVDLLATWLGTEVSALPTDGSWSVVHGDLRLDNLILAPDRPEVKAVLDWEMSTLGDPLADLAVTLVYWTEAGDRLRTDVPVAQHVTSGPGFWTREQVVEAYVSQTGRDVEHLDVCLALACLKLAVIMESIRMRTLHGAQLGTGAHEADEMGRATEALAAMGMRVARGGGLKALGE